MPHFTIAYDRAPGASEESAEIGPHTRHLIARAVQAMNDADEPDVDAGDMGALLAAITGKDTLEQYRVEASRTLNRLVDARR